MSRLPNPGSDENTWGNVLNDYLRQEHAKDGTHDVAKILGAPAQNDQILVSDTLAARGVSWQSKSVLQASGVATGGTAGQVLKKNSTSDYDTGWVSLDKSSVGLDQADNTSDADKPISTAAQTALSGKQAANSDLTDIAALHATDDDVLQRKSGNWISRSPSQLKSDLALTQSDVGLANVDNTHDADKPVSTAQQAALDQKAAKKDIIALAAALG
jgi:hypothetical protein